VSVTVRGRRSRQEVAVPPADSEPMAA